MDKYYALNVKELCYFDKKFEVKNPKNMEETFNGEESLKYLIFYQLCDEDGEDIGLWSSTGPLFKLKNVIFESLHYVIYTKSKGYKIEKLEKYVECGKINLDKILEEEGFYIKEFEDIEETKELKPIGIRPWRSPLKEEVSEFFANKNGFYEIDYKVISKIVMNETCLENRCLEISVYFLNKKLHERVIQEICGYRRLPLGTYDCTQFCEELLNSKKLKLNQEESIVLFDKLSKNFDCFYIYDGSTVFGKKENVFFIKSEDGNYMIKENDEKSKFITWIIAEKSINALNKAKILG